MVERSPGLVRMAPLDSPWGSFFRLGSRSPHRKNGGQAIAQTRKYLYQYRQLGSLCLEHTSTAWRSITQEYVSSCLLQTESNKERCLTSCSKLFMPSVFSGFLQLVIQFCSHQGGQEFQSWNHNRLAVTNLTSRLSLVTRRRNTMAP